MVEADGDHLRGVDGQASLAAGSGEHQTRPEQRTDRGPRDELPVTLHLENCPEVEEEKNLEVRTSEVVDVLLQRHRAACGVSKEVAEPQLRPIESSAQKWIEAVGHIGDREATVDRVAVVRRAVTAGKIEPQLAPAVTGAVGDVQRRAKAPLSVRRSGCSTPVEGSRHAFAKRVGQGRRAVDVAVVLAEDALKVVTKRADRRVIAAQTKLVPRRRREVIPDRF